MGLNTSVLPFTLRFCVSLALPPLAVYFASRLILLVSEFRVNGWLLALAGLVSVPVNFFSRALWISLRDHREAAALGARLPPYVKGKLIGNYDIMSGLFEEFYNGYPGGVLYLTFSNASEQLFCRRHADEVTEHRWTHFQPPYPLAK